MGYPELRRVAIEMPERAEPIARGTATCSFFSAGADSFYTPSRAGGLIPPSRSATSCSCAASARLSQEENVKESESHVRRVGSGRPRVIAEPATCAVHALHVARKRTRPRRRRGRLALTGVAGRVLIPASHTIRELGIPWGSHPLLDESWTSESVSFLHGGLRNVSLRQDRPRSPSGTRHRWMNCACACR